MTDRGPSKEIDFSTALARSVRSIGTLHRVLGRLPIGVSVLLAASLGFGVLWVISLQAMFGQRLFDLEQRVWDVASEANVWTWANVAVLVLAAAAHGGRAHARWQNRQRYWGLWLTSAALLAALSLDDAASFHETLEPVGERLGGGDGAFHFAWVVAGLPVAVALTGFYVLFAWRQRGSARAYLLAAPLVFFSGAVGFEMMSGAYLSGGGSNVVYALLYHIEEAFEAVGAAMFLAAAAADLDPARHRLDRYIQRKPCADAGTRP